MTKYIRAAGLLLAILLLIGASTVTYAWLTDSGMNAEMNVTMHVHKSYFESGDGTAPTQAMLDARDTDGRYSAQYDEGPFEIKYPIQLYYLAWLQELGYFNLDEDGDGTIDPVYFYISADLDMTDFVLPPIGTRKFEFVGNFNGQGYKISNLTIANNNDDMTDSPETTTGLLGNAEIVGFFGVVGSIGADAGKGAHACDSATGNQITGKTYSYDSSVNEISNFLLENVTVTTESATSLAGIVAGYVNGTVSKARVISSDDDTTTDATEASKIVIKDGTVKLDGTGATALSDYAIVGYTTKTAAVDVRQITGKVAVGEQSQYVASDAGNAWGGSIGMTNMYNRISAVTSATNTLTPYSTDETVTIDELEGTKNVVVNNTATTLATNYRYRYLGASGSYYFEPGQYLYNGGRGSNVRTKTVTTITLKKNAEGTDYLYLPGYYYQSGGNYLNINAAGTALQGGTGANTAWTLTDEGYLQTVTTASLPVYLNVVNGEVIAERVGKSTWTYDSSARKLRCREVGEYLTYSNGIWTLSTGESYLVIEDGQGNYLRFTSTTAVENTKTVSQASRWTWNGQTLQTTLNGTTYYLRYNNNALSLDRTNSTTWTSDANGLHSGNNYIYQNGARWMCGTLPADTYTIAYNGTYLNADATATNKLAAQSDQTIATRWTLSNATGNTTIGVRINGSTYYVRRDSTPLSTTSTTWTRSLQANGTVKYYNGSTYYLRYSGTAWQTNTRNTDSNDTLTVTAASVAKGKIPAYSDVTRSGNTTVQAIEGRVETLGTGPLSYFPLTVEGDKTGTYSMTGNSLNVVDANTGYVVSASYSGTSDIRVSRYAISNISNSYSTNSKNITNVRTITANNSGAKTTTTINLTTGKDSYGHEYVKFLDSLGQLKDTLAEDTSNVYGMHFMKSAISMDHIITAPAATVNGTTYENYQLPEDCIDFTLKEKGYINFFAGTYYSQRESSFFSLNQIFRDPETYEILDIKAISKVYQKNGEPGADYVYLFSDGTYSESGFTAGDGTLLFDLAWIGDQGANIDQKWIYYFEIPTNSGEYALGSIENSNGAYLLYLDISAAAQTVDRIQTLEVFDVYEAKIQYPVGVEFLESASDMPLPGATVTNDGADSATFRIGAAGTYAYTRSTDTGGYSLISPKPTTNQTLTFAGAGTRVPDGIPSAITVTNRGTTPIARIFRIIDNDINETTGVGAREIITIVEEGSDWYVTTKMWLCNDGTTTTTDPIATMYYETTKDNAIKQSYYYTPGQNSAPGTYSVTLAGYYSALTGVTLTAADGYSLSFNGTTPGSTSIGTVAASTLGANEETPSLLPYNLYDRIDSNTAYDICHYVTSSDISDYSFELSMPTFSYGGSAVSLVPVFGNIHTVNIDAVAYETAEIIGTASGTSAKPITAIIDLETDAPITVGEISATVVTPS